MKNIDSMFPTDNSLSGHGLTLTKMYRSYKNSPHNVDATYLKYLVHRLENADKYESASLEEKNKMDVEFLGHHQTGGAAEKNGRITTDHLKSFMLNPDTPKLAKQLLNHKKQLSNFIQKEHSEHIVNINGEPHLRLTRGLNVDRAGRGMDHALASYADDSETGFGAHMHHQLVPLKNLWFAYDYGPKGATSKEFGNENEFLVSPHQNVYNEEHTVNPTKPIVVRAHHSLKANNIKFKSYSKKLSQQQFDDIVNKNPYDAAEFLHDHPLFNASNIQTIVEKDPYAAAVRLRNHPLFDANHIQAIAENDPRAATYHLNNHPLFNEKHIDTIAKKDPIAVAYHLNNHPLFNEKHIDTIIQTEPYAAQYLSNHPLLNERHIDTIVQKNPSTAAEYFKNNPIYQAKYGNKVQKSLQKSIKQASEVDSMFPTDNSLKGHGLTLTKVYRSYKNSPHNVDATYGKYLVHRLENADKYESANPQEKFKMDIDFLDHHQKGSAADKNGHMTTSHLKSFMLNPDTPKLAKQLLNHKKQLSDFIQKEHPEHIVNINGEPHLRLTRGLNVDRAKRGADHALASYADVPNTGFGTHMHHQLVPLKNVWFAYDYGHKGATSKKHGNENEFVVSPHQNIYNEEHTVNPTKPIAYRKLHGLKMNEEVISNYVKNYPLLAAKYLKNHPLLNANHIQSIAEKDPYAAAMHFNNHKLLNERHIDTIAEKEPTAAAVHLFNHPIYRAKYGNKVQKSLQKSTKISKQLSNKVRQLLNSKAVLNKTRGTLKFPKILPKDTRPEENVKQIPKDEPEHEQYGGLFTVKPAEQQFIQAALAGAPSKEKHREAPQIRQQIHGGGLGGAYTLKTKQAFAFNPAFHVKAHEGLHSLVGKAAQKLQVKEDDVYNHLNSLIHPEDQAKLKATLSAYDYKPHTHPTEMIPRISDILHDKKVRSAFLNQHYPIDQDWSTFNPNTLTTEFHDPNVKAGWQAIQRLGRTWNAIVKMGKELEKLP